MKVFNKKWALHAKNQQNLMSQFQENTRTHAPPIMNIQLLFGINQSYSKLISLVEIFTVGSKHFMYLREHCIKSNIQNPLHDFHSNM